MKKLLLAILLVASAAVCAFGQSNPPLTVTEVDGSPRGTNITKIVVSNGTLTISGHTATISTGGGGGGGCTPPGTLGRILYDDGAGGCLSITGATTNGTFVTLTTPVIGAATGTSLTVTGNVQVGVAALYKFGGSNSFSYTDDVGPKWTDGNTVQDLIFNVQSLTANRTVTWPDASGTATLLGNSSTGSGAVVLAGTPTIATPSFTTGFTIGGTAATGTIPRGNGTNFVASTFTMAAPGTSGNVLTSDGTNWTSAAPSGGGITVGTTAIASGTATRLVYETSGNKFGEISGATSDGTTVTLTSPTINTGITLNAAPLTMSGNINAAAWTTSGIRIKGSAVTLTDTSSSGTVAAAYTNVLGGNTIAASSSTTFTDYFNTFIAPPAAGSNVTITNAWALGLSGRQRINRDGIGTTNATGIELANATAAAAGAQQQSPDTVWTGAGWKTTATAASQAVNFRAYVLPVQGSSAPTANWVLQSQINGGGYTTRAQIDSAGVLTLPTSGAYVLVDPTSGGSSLIRWGGATNRGIIASNNGLGFVNASNEIYLGNQTGTSGRSLGIHSAGYIGWPASGGGEQTAEVAFRRGGTGLIDLDSATAIGTTPGNARDLRHRAGYFIETSSDPSASALTIAGGNAKDVFAIYMKNDKLVIAYNNSGTVTYITIPLDGSTTTWTHSTSAP